MRTPLAALVAVLLISIPAWADQTFKEVDLWGQAVTTGSNVLGTSLDPLSRGGTTSTPNVGAVTYRVMVAVESGSSDTTFSVRGTKTSGGTSKEFLFNGGAKLENGKLYTFSWVGYTGCLVFYVRLPLALMSWQRGLARR